MVVEFLCRVSFCMVVEFAEYLSGEHLWRTVSEHREFHIQFLNYFFVINYTLEDFEVLVFL